MSLETGWSKNEGEEKMLHKILPHLEEEILGQNELLLNDTKIIGYEIDSIQNALQNPIENSPAKNIYSLRENIDELIKRMESLSYRLQKYTEINQELEKELLEYTDASKQLTIALHNIQKNEALTEELFDAWETSSKSILIIVEEIGAILKQQLPLPPQPPSN